MWSAGRTGLFLQRGWAGCRRARGMWKHSAGWNGREEEIQSRVCIFRNVESQLKKTQKKLIVQIGRVHCASWWCHTRPSERTCTTTKMVNVGCVKTLWFKWMNKYIICWTVYVYCLVRCLQHRDVGLLSASLNKAWTTWITQKLTLSRICIDDLF